ncbi:NADH-quinone oxidoreductase subunit NuoK [bacterium]|nr:NADH-quinone oxidoreductase subunit NuoK [bacterium]
MGPTLDQMLVLSAALFGIGMIGTIVRRSTIAVFMSIELMLNAANLAILAFGRAHGVMEGGILVFVVMTVAAVEVGVGLAILVALFYFRDSTNLDEIDQLKG